MFQLFVPVLFPIENSVQGTGLLSLPCPLLEPTKYEHMFDFCVNICYNDRVIVDMGAARGGIDIMPKRKDIPVFSKKVHSGRGESAGACYTCRYRPCCGCFPVPLTGAESERLQMDPRYLARGRRVLARGLDGLCFYLDNGRCRILTERPAACRVHPGAETAGLPGNGPVDATAKCAEEVLSYKVTIGR